MLTILFSPSENKTSGGTPSNTEIFGAQSARESILQSYGNIIASSDETAISELFGLKKSIEIAPYVTDYLAELKMPAIERYDGVAYDYLDYSSLDSHAKEFLKEHTIIFSNLYGPILAGDYILNYKVKQGNSIGAIAPERFYKERFSYQLDLYLAKSDILDLRAGYYDKFYTPNKEFTTLKFLKDGKVVSHWAKAYRGLVLRSIAQNQTDSIEDFMKLEIEGLMPKEIKRVKNKTEVVYEII
ncbi:MAG: YaaA family protein [Epsilonproteobacteria bacterium]|nr:YaaA family protein [Campylobacterota bacterium]